MHPVLFLLNRMLRWATFNYGSPTQLATTIMKFLNIRIYILIDFGFRTRFCSQLNWDRDCLAATNLAWMQWIWHWRRLVEGQCPANDEELLQNLTNWQQLIQQQYVRVLLVSMTLNPRSTKCQFWHADWHRQRLIEQARFWIIDLELFVQIRFIASLTSCSGGRHNMPLSPVTLTFDLLTLKVVTEWRVTCATSVPILVFLGLSVLDLGPMYATDRRQTDVIQTDVVRRSPSLNASTLQERRHNNCKVFEFAQL